MAFFGGGFGVLFSLLFFLVFGMILFTFVKGIAQWGKNNASPRLIVDARVVAKRTQVTHHHHPESGAAVHAATTYYVTFQVESGDRMELHVTGSAYGMLAEGDVGRLTFQGTRYLGFERSGEEKRFL